MRGRYKERKMRKREREAAMLELVKATGYWDWKPATPWRIVLKVQEGMPNVWWAANRRPKRWDKPADITVCVTLPWNWDKHVHAEGCAVVDGSFVLNVEWIQDNTLEIDQVGKCVWATIRESGYNEILRSVSMYEGFIAGHGGAFFLGNTVRTAVTGVVEKWEHSLGIVKDDQSWRDEMPF